MFMHMLATASRANEKKLNESKIFTAWAIGTHNFKGLGFEFIFTKSTDGGKLGPRKLSDAPYVFVNDQAQ